MPNLDYDNLITSGDFAAASRSFTTRGARLKGDVHKALICSLKCMERCGDYTSSVIPLLDAIKAAFGKNLHVSAQEWVMKHSWLAWSETEKKFFKDHSKVMDIEGAEADGAKRWWETERASKDVPFDAQKSVTNLFDKFEANAKAGGNMAMYLDLVIEKLRKINPNLVTDLFLDLPADKRNEALAVMVATMNPANTEVEVVEAEAKAA